MYYIYFHKNPITLEVFYVGIGSNKRAWRFKERNTHWLRYVKKHGFPVVEIIKENLMSILKGAVKEADEVNLNSSDSPLIHQPH